MAEKGLAMMPWFPRDFIAATRAMRIAERLAYRELLDFQWELGVLPSDESRLARLIGFTEQEFADAWPAIKHKFVQVDGGIANQRLEEHRQKALEQRTRKRNAAAKTNAKRYGERPYNGSQSASLSDSHSDTLSASPPSPSPSPTEEEDSRRGDKSPTGESPKDFIWRVGVDLLTAAGEKNSSARSFLGKLCKEHGDDVVREAVGRAAAVVPADPKSWLQGVLRRNGFDDGVYT